jgi:hypothetical protein
MLFFRIFRLMNRGNKHGTGDGTISRIQDPPAEPREPFPVHGLVFLDPLGTGVAPASFVTSHENPSA